MPGSTDTLATMPTPSEKSAHNFRLTVESVAAAKEAAHQRYLSFNAWVQEAIDEKLERGGSAPG